MKTILAIDDDDAILELLSSALEIEDTTIVTSSDAKNAIKHAKKHKPDVVLLDLMMPEYDGFEFFHILKQMPELSHTKYIMFTAQDTKSNLWESIDLNFDDFISKPFDLSELEIRIRHQLHTTEKTIVRR
ncbi:MAG: response regulator [bacterium]|nr:response regulator [bacterium]